jgi:hypothetical protein
MLLSRVRGLGAAGTTPLVSRSRLTTIDTAAFQLRGFGLKSL